MSLKDAIRIADAERKQPESHKAVNNESNIAVKEASCKAATTAKDTSPVEIEMAGLTVKVPKRHRVHWLIGAKKEGTSLTAAIAEALNARYGEPEEQK